jgi:hypothetical protein
MRLKKAIHFSVFRNPDGVVIGTNIHVFGICGVAHEYGGRFRRQVYPPRPFMRPALLRVLPRLPKYWANSIQN